MAATGFNIKAAYFIRGNCFFFRLRNQDFAIAYIFHITSGGGFNGFNHFFAGYKDPTGRANIIYMKITQKRGYFTFVQVQYDILGYKRL